MNFRRCSSEIFYFHLMKMSKGAFINLFFIACLFFVSGLLNNLLFRAFPEFNFYFLVSIIKVLGVIYLFAYSDFKDFKFVKFVYLGCIIIAFTKVSIMAKAHFLMNTGLIISLNLVGVLMIGFTYWLYLFSKLGLKSFFNFKFWFVAVEICLACLMFPVLSGHFSIVQLTWIAFFSMLIVLVIIVNKIRK